MPECLTEGAINVIILSQEENLLWECNFGELLKIANGRENCNYSQIAVIYGNHR